MPPSQYPVESFSLTERDRRWRLVRALMGSADIDILVVPDENNSRYLTQMAYDVGPTIFPLDGEVTAITQHGQVGSAATLWIEDFRRSNRRSTDAIVARLRELEADRKIVGIVGLDGTMSRPDGDLNYNTFIALREWFPHTRWVGATSLMQEARYIKSDEEIAFLARATAGADAGLLAAADCVRPGVTDRELWAHMALGLARAGVDPPRFCRVGVAESADRGLPVGPVGHTVGTQEVLYAEIASRYTGYEARGAQSLGVGPAPRAWQDAWQAHLEAWQQTWETLRPGVTFDEISAAVQPAAWGPYCTRQALVGVGLGDDLPAITSSGVSRNPLHDRGLEEGVCFALLGSVEWTDSQGNQRIDWGDTVAITEEHAQRLGRRPHELIVND